MEYVAGGSVKRMVERNYPHGLPPALRDEIRATHKHVTESTRRWRREDGQLAYAGSNASEHAELAERKSRPGLSEDPAP